MTADQERQIRYIKLIEKQSNVFKYDYALQNRTAEFITLTMKRYSSNNTKY